MGECQSKTLGNDIKPSENGLSQDSGNGDGGGDGDRDGDGEDGIRV